MPELQTIKLILKNKDHEHIIDKFPVKLLGVCKRNVILHIDGLKFKTAHTPESWTVDIQNLKKPIIIITGDFIDD